jgi:hypothetical protein
MRKQDYVALVNSELVMLRDIAVPTVSGGAEVY